MLQDLNNNNIFWSLLMESISSIADLLKDYIYSKLILKSKSTEYK